MKLGLAIRELHRSENDLAHELLQISDRHKSDHEVFYVAGDLALWSQEHVSELAAIGRDYEQDLDAEPEGQSTVAERVREKSAEMLGRRPEPAL